MTSAEDIPSIARQMFANDYAPIPIAPYTKNGVPMAWPDKAPRSEQAFLELWESVSTSVNVGLVCLDIITVVDFDNHGDQPNGLTVYYRLLSENPDVFKGAIVERTASDGIHAVFRGELGEKVHARFNIDGKDVDVEILRGRRYMVAAPSTLKTGRYVIISEQNYGNTKAADLPPLPVVFRAAIVRKSDAESENLKKMRAATAQLYGGKNEELDDYDRDVIADYYYDQFSSSPEGSRHDNTLAYAIMLCDIGMHDCEVERRVKRLAASMTRFLSSKELEDILRYAPRYAKGDTFVPWSKVWDERKRRRNQKLLAGWKQ